MNEYPEIKQIDRHDYPPPVRDFRPDCGIEHHDYNNPYRVARGKCICEICGADITTIVVLQADSLEHSKQ